MTQERARRNRRASHPGTSEAARRASAQPDEKAPTGTRPAGRAATDEPRARDAREQWLLDERPPHWG